MDNEETLGGQEESQENKISNERTTEMWQSPLSQSTYLFFWAIASIASFAIFFRFF
tara:strand:+ start:1329 stop:1496 length:168 start_codon:yes stop_codon:yes gene_type:complete